MAKVKISRQEVKEKKSTLDEAVKRKMGKGASIHKGNTIPTARVRELLEQKKYKSIKAMPLSVIKRRIDKFINDHLDEVVDEETGETQTVIRVAMTKNALALYLGVDTSTLWRYINGGYRDSNGYSEYGDDTADKIQYIQAIVTFITSTYEGQTFAGNNRTAFDWLKNAGQGWTDESKIIHVGAGAVTQSIEDLNKAINQIPAPMESTEFEFTTLPDGVIKEVKDDEE